MGVHQLTPPLEASSPSDGSTRKRVCKACDRCRLKKSKADNAICVFGERKKSHDKVYPKGYVEMLENQQAQLVMGLQELYRRTQSGQGWAGAPLKETSHGAPLTHDILERLGALKQDGHYTNEHFEEDLSLMQQHLIANGAGFMPREASPDTSSEMGQSPIFEQLPSKPPMFTDPFSLNTFPPTPPSQSPHPHNVRTAAPFGTQTLPQLTPQSQMNWAAANVGFDDNMDFISKFESPVGINIMSPHLFQNRMAAETMNPCLSLKDWQEEDEFQRFFNPALI